MHKSANPFGLRARAVYLYQEGRFHFVCWKGGIMGHRRTR